MRFTRLHPMRDDSWVLPTWGPTRLREDSFRHRLRGLPRHSIHSFQFVAWWLFLVLYLLARLLICVLMVAPFGETKGLQLNLQWRITAEELQQLLDGQPVRDATGAIRIDSARSVIVSDTNPPAPTELEDRVRKVCMDRGPGVSVVLDIVPVSAYRQCVEYLDLVTAIGMRLDACDVRAILVTRWQPPDDVWERVR